MEHLYCVLVCLLCLCGDCLITDLQEIVGENEKLKQEAQAAKKQVSIQYCHSITPLHACCQVFTLYSPDASAYSLSVYVASTLLVL